MARKHLGGGKTKPRRRFVEPDPLFEKVGRKTVVLAMKHWTKLTLNQIIHFLVRGFYKHFLEIFHKNDFEKNIQC